MVFDSQLSISIGCIQLLIYLYTNKYIDLHSSNVLLVLPYTFHGRPYLAHESINTFFSFRIRTVDIEIGIRIIPVLQEITIAIHTSFPV